MEAGRAAAVLPAAGPAQHSQRRGAIARAGVRAHLRALDQPVYHVQPALRQSRQSGMGRGGRTHRALLSLLALTQRRLPGLSAGPDWLLQQLRSRLRPPTLSRVWWGLNEQARPGGVTAQLVEDCPLPAPPATPPVHHRQPCPARPVPTHRPDRAAMCSGVSRPRCSASGSTSAPSSHSRQIASTLAGPCSAAQRSTVRHRQTSAQVMA